MVLYRYGALQRRVVDSRKARNEREAKRIYRGEAGREAIDATLLALKSWFWRPGFRGPALRTIFAQTN